MSLQELTAVQAHYQNCNRCELARTRTNLVFGDGNPDAELMLIGEAPGKNEDLQGKPFVGRAGQILNNALAQASLSRDDIYIANILKCRPPSNRDPLPGEIQACNDILNAQINAIKPKVIMPLGRFATAFCLGAEFTSMGNARGKLYDRGWYFVLPTYHPAACIYDASKLPTLLSDFRLVHTAIADIHARLNSANL